MKTKLTKRQEAARKAVATRKINAAKKVRANKARAKKAVATRNLILDECHWSGDVRVCKATDIGKLPGRRVGYQKSVVMPAGMGKTAFKATHSKK